MPRPAIPRILKGVGYLLAFLVAFGLALVWTFPLDRFSERFERLLSEKIGRSVHIAHIDTSLAGDIVLTGLEIEVPRIEEARRFEAESEPENTSVDAPVLFYVFEEVVVDVGWLDLLLGWLDIDVDAEGMDGTLRFAYEGPWSGEKRSEDEGDISLVFELREVSLARLWDLRAMIPVPVSGTLDFYFQLSAKTGKFADADGLLRVDVKNGVIGQAGKEALVGGMPVNFDPVAVSEVRGALKIEKGKGRVDQVIVQSKHFDLKVQGGMELRDPFEQSDFDLYFMFKFLDAYRNQNEKTRALLGTLEQVSSDLRRARRTDGYYGFRYRGRLGHGRLTPSSDFRPGNRAWLMDERERLRQLRDEGPQEPREVDNRPLSERLGVVGAPPGAPAGMVSTPPIVPPSPVAEPVASEAPQLEPAAEPVPPVEQPPFEPSPDEAPPAEVAPVEELEAPAEDSVE